MKKVKNPALFRELSEPFPNREEAIAACAAFFEAVSKAREEHKLPNVTVIAGYTALAEDGEEMELMGMAHYGDSLRALPMLAQAYEKRGFEDLIAKAVANG